MLGMAGRGAMGGTLIAAGHAVHLAQAQEWQRLVTGWAEARRQPDICEFMAHILGVVQPSIFQGSWQA